MFGKINVRRDVADIQSLLGVADPASGLPDGRSGLAAAWQRVSAQTTQTAPATRAAQTVQAAPERRAWWPGRPARQRRRKIVVTCVAVPALAAASAAGWAIANDTPASHVAQNIWCWSSPRGGDGGGSVQLPSTGQVPTAVCAQQWASGNMNPAVRTVPSLVACSMGSFDGGSIGVYPDTTCQALHLRPVPSGYQQAARSFAALTNTLAADGLYADGLQAHPVVRCWSAAKAVALTRQALQSNGFTGWRIVVRPFPRASSCASDAPDSATHTVLILGV
jgi:hypothetical protein